MASSASIRSFRRRRLPSAADFPAPVNLAHGGLIQTLLSFAREIVSSSHCNKIAFQRRNSRSLIRKIELFVVLLESMDASGIVVYSHKSHLCFMELHLILYRSRILLDYCFESSKLWLILRNAAISSHYSDLSREIATLLDVFPIEELKLDEDLKEQIRLTQKQLRRSNSHVYKEDETLRRKLYSFLDDFENAGPPDDSKLRFFFVDQLKIQDSRSFEEEIEFMEKELRNHEDETRPSASIISGFIALARYSRFLLFGFDGNQNHGMIGEKIGDNSLSVPKDFCCPVTLELMIDPVIISTGQTYDRSSVKRWMDEGHQTCPKTGQKLTHTRLIPNQALKNLIVRWCDAPDPSSNVQASKAAIGANKATIVLLIEQVENGSEVLKGMIAWEMRLMARESRENRAFMAEAGAIPCLCKLLDSPNADAQENAVTTLLNMSIHGKNKIRIIEEEGCLRLVVNVLKSGFTISARENAAALLFSLSTVHNHKTRIADEQGSIEALTSLLKHGRARGKKDAATTLLNLSSHAENIPKMVESTAVAALVGALRDEEVCEEAAAAIAMVVRRGAGAEAVLSEGGGVRGLVGVMRGGSPKGKENAVAALLEMCRSGGGAASERVMEVPAMAGVLRVLVASGTRRARRKAASLARVVRSGVRKDLREAGLAMGIEIPAA